MAEKKIVISQKDISRRVRELGAAITKDFENSRLLVVGILNGAFMFMADLVREIKHEFEIDFVRVTSYGMGTTAGLLRFTKDIERETQGRDILIVEDIVDTGISLQQTIDELRELGTKSVEAVSLFRKSQAREKKIDVKYVGFDIENEFVVGYGLDYDGLGRNLNAIYKARQ